MKGFMRIKDFEIKAIKEAVHTVDKDARIYIFGSRADAYAKGGDIDILVFSDKINLQEKLIIKRELFKNLEDQKIDIVVAQDFEDPFIRDIYKDAIAL